MYQTNYLQSLIYALDKSQRDRLKKLLSEFDNEGVELQSYEYKKLTLKDIIIDIDHTTEYEELRQKASDAAQRGETTTPRDEWGVHETHCCSKHGCKYGDEDCPVAIGLTTGIRCEDCDYDDDVRDFNCDDSGDFS